MAEPLVECVASYCLVDPRPPRGAREAICPDCGQTVGLGGTPDEPRYEIHNEPLMFPDVSIGGTVSALAAAGFYSQPDPEELYEHEMGKAEAYMEEQRDLAEERLRLVVDPMELCE